jgi:phenol 2-monooxygenase (NADPH)
MGAFGLNVSIIDTANLAWKIGFCAKGHAKLDTLMPTYDYERRLHANRVIEVSGTYLRFVCRSDLGILDLRHMGKPLGLETIEPMAPGESRTLLSPDGKNASKSDPKAREYLLSFFETHGMFLLGLDVAYGTSIINPRDSGASRATTVKCGVRAPNPRVCFDAGHTGYLYDRLTGSSKFHLVVFGSDLLGPVRKNLAIFSRAITDPRSFYNRFGGKERFNIVLIVKGAPFEVEESIVGMELSDLKHRATLLFDDRPPDEDAHTTYGANHATGAITIVRPDLWTGISVSPADLHKIDQYFDGFLLPVKTAENQSILSNGV